MRKSIIISLCVLSLAACKTARNESTEKPNLLFIWTDQQQFNTMAAYGNSAIQAPHLNELAAKGVVFKKAYVSYPLCTPCRSSVMTGLYPHTNGCVMNNIPLPAEIETLNELVNDPEYISAYMGKWHLGDEIFLQHGFDEWVSMEDGYTGFYSEGRDRDERSSYHHWLVEKGYMPDENNMFSRQYATELTIEHCKPEFLKENAARFLRQHADKPFILYVNFLEPHNPFNGPLNDLHDMADIELPENYNDLPWENVQELEDVPEAPFRKTALDEQAIKETKRKYWGLVSQVDRSVGGILDVLEEEGLSDNTIIVYTSDHGEMMGAHRMMGKNNPFEEASRIPLIIYDPRFRGEQRILDGPVSLIDLVPTLLDLLGTEVPPHLQGKSLAPVIKGGDYPGSYVFIEGRFRAVVSPDNWKLVIMEEINFLFNLNDDPLEKKNLYYLDEYREKKELLLKKLADWQEQTDDPFILAVD